MSFEDDPRDMMRIAAPIEEDDPYKKGEMLVSLWMRKPRVWGRTTDCFEIGLHMVCA